MSDHQQEYAPLSGCFVRLFWLLAGNALLALALIQLFFSSSPIFSWGDAFYWLVVVLILLARYVDIRYFHGTTAEGKPSTYDDWRRHAIILAVVAGAAWFAVHMALLI